MTYAAYSAIFIIALSMSTAKLSAMYVKGSEWPGGQGFVTLHVEKLRSAEITTEGLTDDNRSPSEESPYEHSSSLPPDISSPSVELATTDLTSSKHGITKNGDSSFVETNSVNTIHVQDNHSSNLSASSTIKQTAKVSSPNTSSDSAPPPSTMSSKPKGMGKIRLVSPIPLAESQTTSPPRRRRTTSRLKNSIITKDGGLLPIVVQERSGQLIKPLYQKQKVSKPAKPFNGIYEWKKRPSRNDDDDRRSTLLILPLLTMFIFIFASIGRCINWCTEDVRIADSKHKHYIEPVNPFNYAKSYNGSLRSAYSHTGILIGAPAVPSPLLSRNSSGHSTRSLRTLPERRRRKPSVNLSADDVRKIDQHHKRPPALAARTASGSALQRHISNNSLRRQVHLDKNKAQWGVKFEKRRRESDASSGIATTHGSTSKIKFDISPQKEVSSPSSQGYVSNSESFGDGTSLPCGCRPSPLAERAVQHIPVKSHINNSDLSLARALLQLQRLSMGVSLNVGASETLSIGSESACSTAVSSPPIDENGSNNHPFLKQRHMFPDPVDADFDMEEKDDNNQDSDQSGEKVISNLTMENVASMSSSSGCNDMHGMVATPSTSTAGEDSPSTVTAPSLIGAAAPARSVTSRRVRSESVLQQEMYEEDPIFCAVQRISRSPYFHKHLQRMTSDDDPLCHSSGLSSKHSSCCSDEGEHSLSFSGSLRLVFDNCGSSPWNSFDNGQSPTSSVSSGVGGVSPQLYTTATVHQPPSRMMERQDSVASSPTEASANRPRHTPRHRRRGELPRQNTTSLTALRRLHSKELLQKISKISQPGYPGRNKRRPQLNQCHSWCGPGTMETQVSSNMWRKSVAMDREYYF